MIAIAADYVGALIGRGFPRLRVSPAHFAERHGLIVIIALGESIVAIGIGAAGVPLTSSIVVAALLGSAVLAALWWAYFDVFAVGAQQQLSKATGLARSRLARDYYSYLHLPMIAGIVLFALGLKKTIEQVDDPLETIPALALCGGLSLYFLTHVALRIRIVREIRRTTTERPGWIGPGQVVHGHRHARNHTRGAGDLGAGVTRARDRALLGADRLRRLPLSRGTLPGARASALNCGPPDDHVIRRAAGHSSIGPLN